MNTVARQHIECFMYWWNKKSLLAKLTLITIVSVALSLVFFRVLGTRIDLFLEGTRYHDDMWTAIGVFCIFPTLLCISKGISEHVKLKNDSIHDHLTKLYNDNYKQEGLRLVYSQARRQNHEGHGEKFAIYVIDVNRLSTINNTYGHFVGSEVIKFIAKKIKEVFSRDTHDIVLRNRKADEYLVLSSTNDPEKLFKEIVQHLKEESLHFTVGDQRIPVSAAVGHAVVEPQKNNPTIEELNIIFEEAFKEADAQMYENKEAGR